GSMGRFAPYSSVQAAQNHKFTHNTVVTVNNSIFKGVDPGNVAPLAHSNNIIFRDNLTMSGGNFFNAIHEYPGLITDHNIIVDNSGLGCAASRDAAHCAGWTPSATDQLYTSWSSVRMVNKANGDLIDGYGNGGDYHNYKLQCPGSPGCGAA